MEEKKINVSISEGQEFFAHEVTVNFNPTQMILDFKCITPRSDPRNQQGPTIAIRHNIVLMDVYHAQMFHQLLGSIISRYEKEFGKIKKPKAVEEAEKRNRSKSQEQKKEKTTIPSYFG